MFIAHPLNTAGASRFRSTEDTLSDLYAFHIRRTSSVRPEMSAVRSKLHGRSVGPASDSPISFVLNSYTPYTLRAVAARKSQTIKGPKKGAFRGWK